MFYDKLNQALDMTKGDRDLIAESNPDLNLLRYEIQNKKPAAIEATQRYGKRLKFGDLWEPEILERTGQLRIDTFNKLFDRNNKYGKEHEKNLSVLIQMKEKSVRPLNDFILYIAIQGSIITASILAQYMRDAGFSRPAIKKAVDRIKQLPKGTRVYSYLDEIYSLIKSKAA
jgi:hypothetical protein